MSNKKYTYYFLSIVLYSTLWYPAFSQTQSDSWQSVMDIVDPNGLNQNLTFGKKYADFQGDPYLLKVWGIGNITTHQGKSISGVEMNVDLYTNEALVRLDNKEMLLSPEAFQAAQIITNDRKEILLELAALPDQIEKKFVEILYNGKISLLRWQEVSVKKMENNAGGYSGSSNTASEVQKFFRSTHYYLQKRDRESIVEIEPRDKDILSHMEDQENVLKKYIKKEKLKLKREEDLIQLIQYYDRLTN